MHLVTHRFRDQSLTTILLRGTLQNVVESIGSLCTQEHARSSKVPGCRSPICNEKGPELGGVKTRHQARTGDSGGVGKHRGNVGESKFFLNERGERGGVGIARQVHKLTL